MKIFEKQDEFGNIMYCAKVGGETKAFPSLEAREKFLFRLFMDWLEKMLRSQMLLEALKWFWEQREQRQEDMQKIMEQHFSVFVALLLPWDNYFYYLPQAVLTANQTYLQGLVRNLMEMTIDLIWVAPPSPSVKPSPTFEEALARTRAAKAAKNEPPRG